MIREPGYVYIFKNSELPGKYKIGQTHDRPEVRANYLSKQTSSPGKFDVFWSAKATALELAEKFLHLLFNKHHYNKEFFDLSVYDEDSLLEILSDFKKFTLTLAKFDAILQRARIQKLENSGD